MALVSDAGTPAISDPGFILVDKCRNEEIEIDALPGCSAVTLAISQCGFPSDRFLFEGYILDIPF